MADSSTAGSVTETETMNEATAAASAPENYFAPIANDTLTASSAEAPTLKRPASDAVEPAPKKARKDPKKVNNEQWEYMFDKLVAYKGLHGDCLVPKRYAADPKLGTWVETQRAQYKRLIREVDQTSGQPAVTPNNRLNPQRLEKLESIGFVWSAKHVRKTPPPIVPKAPSVTNAVKKEGKRGATMNVAQWNEMYDRLAKYKETYGDCLVPRKYEADPKLSTWVEAQRAHWNRDYREECMELAASAVASTPEAHEDSLSESFFPKDMSGSPPEAVAAVAPAAAEWNMEDFATSMASASTMESDQEAVVTAAMEAANEVVDGTFPGEAAIYAGDTTGPNDAMDSKMPAIPAAPPILPPPPAKRMTKERKEKLDALGFVWSLRSKRIEDHWDEMFRQLCAYKEQHGDCLVPSRYEANLKLGKWVETQRYEYTKLQRSNSAENPLGAAPVAVEQPSMSKGRATNPRLTDERLRRLESIGFEWKVKHKMKRYYDKQWDQMFDRLLRFKEENMHCMVPKRYPPDMKLGTWVHTQRIQYRKLAARDGKKEEDGSCPVDTSYLSECGIKREDEVTYRLTDERRRRLESIGFVWSARESDKTAEQARITRNSYDDQWDSMFQRLVEYKAKFGDCLVPKRFKEDNKLGTWVDTQRVQYKKMKKKIASNGNDSGSGREYEEEDQAGASASNKPVLGRLTEARIQRLEELGFVWSLRDDWQKHFDELKIFKEEHGHCNVPARYPNNRRLGIWVSAQRQQHKIMQLPPAERPKRSAPLTQDRIDQLNNLGFTWTIRSRDTFGESWNQRLQELRDYKERHGNCLVPSRYSANPELGTWVGTQRTQYRVLKRARENGDPLPAGTLMNDERIEQLEAIGFVWNIRGETSKRASLSLAYEEIEQEAIDAAGVLAAGASQSSMFSESGRLTRGNPYEDEHTSFSEGVRQVDV